MLEVAVANKPAFMGSLFLASLLVEEAHFLRLFILYMQITVALHFLFTMLILITLRFKYIKLL